MIAVSFMHSIFPNYCALLLSFTTFSFLQNWSNVSVLRVGAEITGNSETDIGIRNKTIEVNLMSQKIYTMHVHFLSLW